MLLIRGLRKNLSQDLVCEEIIYCVNQIMNSSKTYAGRHRFNVRIPLLLFILPLVACSNLGINSKAKQYVEGSPADEPLAQATEVWTSLLKKSAYPYNNPLPPQEPTLVDGLYEKFESKKATPIPCRRCPDYMIEGGIWRLSFEKGTFHILHVPTGWQGLGSYEIRSGRLYLFNDPKCPKTTGIYHWQLSDRVLILDVLRDDCAADLRGHNLGHLPWTPVSTN